MLSLRTNILKNLFSYDTRAVVEDVNIELVPFRFTEQTDTESLDAIRSVAPPACFCSTTDDAIEENKDFSYVVFNPAGKTDNSKAIIMLHGLNEGTWDKYLAWAEKLCINLGRPIILFPIAFHMNRAPREWRNPRSMMKWSKSRVETLEGDRTTTFANAALSIRISGQPLRFYTSGIETVNNIQQLASEIRSGRHPLFVENSTVDLFSYSIGALLSQVIMMANPSGLFSRSRLFMFCGGSLFSLMNGSARDILDFRAFMNLKDYYSREFLEGPRMMYKGDSARAETAFRQMIMPDYGKYPRESFFVRTKDRIKAITLRLDTVVPTSGVRSAMGDCADEILEEMHFPFEYSHQIPFPMGGNIADEEVDAAFSEVFDRACNFF